MIWENIGVSFGEKINNKVRSDKMENKKTKNCEENKNFLTRKIDNLEKSNTELSSINTSGSGYGVGRVGSGTGAGGGVGVGTSDLYSAQLARLMMMAEEVISRK